MSSGRWLITYGVMSDMATAESDASPTGYGAAVLSAHTMPLLVTPPCAEGAAVILNT